uniref:Transthyretin-like family-containing protein n=1 Tax=Strongyloides stercoralis TaxID=6248 RepID=A0A0K0ELU5_STRER
MINLKIFLIILTILIYVTFEIKYFFHKPKFGVTGVFYCRYRSNASIYVSISDNTSPYETKPLALVEVKGRKQFFIVIKKRYNRNFNTYVKVYHNCLNATENYRSILIKKIPENFIYQKCRFKKFYNLGLVDLTREPRIFSSCIPRG